MQACEFTEMPIINFLTLIINSQIASYFGWYRLWSWRCDALAFALWSEGCTCVACADLKASKWVIYWIWSLNFVEKKKLDGLWNLEWTVSRNPFLSQSLLSKLILPRPAIWSVCSGRAFYFPLLHVLSFSLYLCIFWADFAFIHFNSPFFFFWWGGGSLHSSYTMYGHSSTWLLLFFVYIIWLFCANAYKFVVFPLSPGLLRQVDSLPKHVFCCCWMCGCHRTALPGQ